MKSLLLLQNVSLENANAINGQTYGFPAISHFLGFTHALSRKLHRLHGLKLGGCAVVCHSHQLQAYQPGDRGDWVFALTRNPLTKEGNTSPFNEEGRVHLQLSLLIECEFDVDDLPFNSGNPEEDSAFLTRWVSEQVPCLRIAGGTISTVKQIRWFELHQESNAQEKQFRQLMMRLLPGFVLIGRHDLLLAHHQKRSAVSPSVSLLDSWLDFVGLQYSSGPADANGSSEWLLLSKPAPGYLVPIMVGYQAISELYPANSVKNCRDTEHPFCFVESVYSIGQWLSPHRIQSLEQIIWRYQYQDGLYLCHNGYSSLIPEEIDLNEEVY